MSNSAVATGQCSSETADFAARDAAEGLTTPVALFVYNRPQVTAEVLEALRRVRPRSLYVVADGPRGDVPDDAERCGNVAAVLAGIDWQCQVSWNRSQVNLGCRRRMQTGIDWVFRQTEEAILLEDDCVPDVSFFAFCEAMLGRYRYDPKVLVVSGCNMQMQSAPTPASYYFSRYPIVGGWAAWRRTWALYDAGIDAWPALRNSGWLDEFIGDKLASAYWKAIFDCVRDDLDAWDYSLSFSCWQAGGLAIHPRHNLVRNIGFGADATHTQDPRSPLAAMPVMPMRFPLSHPPAVERNIAADALIERFLFSGTPERLLRRVRGALRKAEASRSRATDPMRS